MTRLGVEATRRLPDRRASPSFDSQPFAREEAISEQVAFSLRKFSSNGISWRVAVFLQKLPSVENGVLQDLVCRNFNNKLSAMTSKHSQQPPSPAESSSAKVNQLLILLMRAGWRDLFLNHFALENSTDADEDLLHWILHGHMDSESSNNVRRMSAWLATQRHSSFNDLLQFLRRSTGEANFADESGQTILHLFLRSCLDDLPRRKSLRVVRQLIEFGASVDSLDGEDYTPLHVAAEKAEVALIEAILPSFSRVDAATGFYGDTVLHDVVYACNKDAASREDRYTQVAGALLAKGADPNFGNRHGITPVQLAVEYNFLGMLQLFQAHGADFHRPLNDDETLLHLACQEGCKNPGTQLRLVDFLVERGCDVNARDKNGHSPLHYAAKLSSARIVARLLQLGSRVDVKTTNLGLTPLHVAASFNRPNCVAALLRAGADANAEAANGVTPLHMAASRDGIKAVKCLIEHGADVSKLEQSFGFTPLHVAASSGCRKKLEMLLRRGGVPVDVKSHDGVTPLHLACLNGNLRAVEVLTRQGADANCRATGLKLTALHLAAMKANGVDANSWIFKGKDLRDRTLFGMFKSSETIDDESVAVAESLIKRGVDVNAKDARGRTPLHLASLHPTSELIEPLLQFGAHVDEHDDEGRSPLRNGVESGCAWGLKCLLKYGGELNEIEPASVDKRLFGLLEVHAAKMRMIGLLPVMHWIVDCPGMLDPRAFVDVETMKSWMIDDSDICLYEFLRMTPRRRVALAEAVMSADLESALPEFCDVVRASCRQAVDRMSLMEPAMAALSRVSNRWWPEICAEEVLSYLKNTHLRKLIASADGDVEMEFS